MSYQQSRFMNLMEGYKQSTDLYAKALDSTGTAEKKFQLYQQGTEAQLARLKDSWDALWMSMFKSSDLNMLIGGLNGLVSTVKNVVDVTGTLPPILAVAGTAIIAFNGGFKSIMTTGTNMLTLLKALPSGFTSVATREAATTLQTTALTGATDLLSASLKGLKVATTFAVGAILPMLAFAGIGYAIEKVTQAISDYNQKQQEMKQQQDDLVKSYSSNSNEIDKLASKYEKLNAKASSDSTVENSKEYVDTMNQLGKLMPSLVQSTDAHGNSILKSRDAVKEELDYTKQLKEQYDKLSVVNFEKDLDSQAKKVDDILSKIKSYKDNASGTDQSPIIQAKGIPQVDEGAKVYDQTQIIAQERELKLALSDSKQYMQDKAKAMMNVEGVTDKLSSSSQKLVDTYINEAVANKKNIKDGEDFKNFLSDTINKAVDLAEALSKVPKALDGVFTASQASGFTKDQLAVLKSINTESKDGYNNWESYRGVLTKVFKDSSLVNNIISTLSDTTKKASSATKDYSLTQDEIDKKLQEAKGNFEATKQAILDIAKAGEYQQAITASEGQAYSALKDELSPINGLLEDMANGKRISAAEAMDLISKEKDLAKYISIENGQVKINEQGVIDLRDAKIKSYQDMINAEKAQVGALDKATQDSLRNYGIQVKGILTVAQANQVLTQLQDENAKKQAEINNSNSPGAMHASIIESNQYNQATSSINGIKDALNSLDQLSSMTSSGLTQVGTTMEKTSNSTKQSIYVADKYTQSLNALNAQLAKLENAQKQYTTGSQSYRAALREEIDLQNQKLQLMQSQEKSLEQQIKTGNIVQTGMVSNSGSTNNSSGSQWTGKYASYINQAAAKYGVDPLLVAAIIQQESSFIPTEVSGAGATGLMQLMPSAARSLGVSNAYDPYQNIMGGTKYISDLLKQFGGNIDKALAAYNWGPNHAAIRSGNVSAMPYETQDYIKKVTGYYSQFGGGKDTSISSSLGQNAADKQQAIDKAKGDLVQLQQDIVTTKSQISDLQFTLLESNLARFDASIAESDTKLKTLDESSAAYRDEVDHQWKLQIEKANDYKAAIDSLTKTEGADSAHVAQLKDEYSQLQEKIASLNWDYYTSAIDEHKNAIGSLTAKIDLSQKTIELYSGNFKVQVDETNKQIDLNNQIIKQLDSEKAVMEQALRNQALDAQQKADLTKQLADLNAQYVEYQINIKNAIDALNQQIETEKQTITSSTDSFIQLYKDFYEQKRKLALNELDKEYNDFEAATKKKLDLIDQQENQNTYNQDLAQKQKDIADLQAQINAFSLDPTQRGKVADLKKQLAQDQLDLQNTVHQHEVQAQKDSLNQQLNDKKTAIDNEKNATNKYYDDIVNDERNFAKMRSDILHGHTTDVLNQLATFKDYITKNMTEIGTVISDNLIDRLDQATQSIKDAGNAANSIQLGNSNQNPIETVAQAVGKVLNDTNAPDKVTIMQDTPLLKKMPDGTFEYTETILKKGQAYKGYGVDNANGVYILGGGYVTTDPKKTKYQYLDTGGYTGDSEGIAYLHKKEIVLNKTDTPNLLKAIDITRNIANLIPKMSLPKIINSVTQQPSINIDVKIGSIQGGKEGADSFFNEINNRLRGKGGFSFG